MGGKGNPSLAIFFRSIFCIFIFILFYFRFHFPLISHLKLLLSGVYIDVQG
jgi:hypothetical protein